MLCGDSVSGSGEGRPSRSFSWPRRPGGPCALRGGSSMLTVEADAARVEERLRSGGLFCPFCAGVLAGWGFARPRWLRDVEGLVWVRPRRAICAGCGRTQVLLSVIGLSRRADVVEVIGASLVAKAAGWGHRQIAVLVGRPAATVRGWLRRFAGRAEVVRAAFRSQMCGEAEVAAAPYICALVPAVSESLIMLPCFCTWLFT